MRVTIPRGWLCSAQHKESHRRSHSVPGLRPSYGCAVPAGRAFGVAGGSTAPPARAEARAPCSLHFSGAACAARRGERPARWP
jgi:hypothetical protein